MSTNTQFEIFWTALIDCFDNFPVESKPYFQEAIQSAGFFQTQTGNISTNTQFEIFWITLDRCPYKFPIEIKPYFQEAIGAVEMGPDFQKAIRAVEFIKKQKFKKLSGYALFMREKVPELKKQNFPSLERMTKIGKMWKTLSKEERATWNVKAETLGSAATVTKTAEPKVLTAATCKIAKKLSCHTFYMREKMWEIRQMWETLSNEEKTICNVKAAIKTLSLTATVTKTAESKPVAKEADGPKKLSGYHLYLRETMAVVKANASIAAKDRMAEIVKMWKALNDEERAIWRVKAAIKTLGSTATVTKTAESKSITKEASGPQKLTGTDTLVINVYGNFTNVMMVPDTEVEGGETMTVVKANGSIAARERMAEIGKMWKALKDKAAYKVKAEVL